MVNAPTLASRMLQLPAYATISSLNCPLKTLWTVIVTSLGTEEMVHQFMPFIHEHQTLDPKNPIKC